MFLTELNRSPARAFAAVLVLATLIFGSASLVAGAAPDERAIVSRRRIVIVRTGALARQFPERKRAVINLPVVSGLSDPKVLRKVRAALDLKNIFGTSLTEYREDAWLEEFDFKVNYNKRRLLDISFWEEGSGAYPDTHHAHFAINLRTGDVLKARDVFEAGALQTLTGMVNKKLRAEIAEQVRVVEQDKDIEDKSGLKEELSGLSFSVENLDNFMVGDTGVTFLYDAGFPHVIQALQPEGQYFFTYAQLAPYVRRDGPLGVFVK
ncbi:MAG: hypothetical protein QOH49_4667 [Acidobacteriota bacterium]|jgi:hypothetical protein|nr:hypothetical protein [Acidobacteriota bacterium]